MGCLENWKYGPLTTWHPYPQKLAITSPTSGGRSVRIVRSRTQTMEFVCLYRDMGGQFTWSLAPWRCTYFTPHFCLLVFTHLTFAPKYLWNFTALHGLTSQKTLVFIVTDKWASSPACSLYITRAEGHVVCATWQDACFSSTPYVSRLFSDINWAFIFFEFVFCGKDKICVFLSESNSDQNWILDNILNEALLFQFVPQRKHITFSLQKPTEILGKHIRP
jgi:hypothetical protein